MEYKTKYNIAVDLIKKGYLIHCTDNNFEQFDSSFIKSGGRAKEGYGFYFSDMPYKSIDYGKNWKIIKKNDFNFLNSHAPINIHTFINTFEIDLIKLDEELYNVKNVRDYDRISKEISNIKTIYNKIGGRELFDNIEKTIKLNNVKTIGALEYYINNPKIMVPKLTQLYVYWGYDGYETDGIYTVFNFKKLNQMVKNFDITKYNITESLDLSSFETKETLNPDFWKNGLLNSRIRLKLLDIADDFTDFLNIDWVKPDDIIMTGSLANYNWSKEYSDIDLHIIIDFKKVDKRIDFVREYFQSKKELWNQKHKNIKIYGFPVEVYVQDKNENHSSSGIYSLEKNNWVIKPEKKSPTKKNLNQAEKEAEKWMNKIDSLIDVYDTNEIETKKEKVLNNLDKVFDKIKNSRRKSFKKGKDELNKNNLTFKMLRRYGYLDKISHKKNEIYDNLMSLNENIIDNIISEKLNNFTLLKESQESKSQSEAIKLVMNKFNWDYDKANEFVRISLRNDLPSLRDKNIGKFTLGVTRMFCDGQLNDARIINNLNSTLKLMSAHLNEYDRNLNNLSAQELISKFEKTRNDNMENEKNEINSMQFSGQSDYRIIPINSFKEAKEYYKYTNPNSPWCLTYMEDMFDSYTSNGINQIYFCLRDGFENVEPVKGENCPLDEYGLSMISVIVNENGELAYCTSRWNHANGSNDSVMNAKELSNVIGVNFYDVFKPNNRWNELVQSAMERIRNGESPEDVFDDVSDFYNGYAYINLKGKCNFINIEGNLVFPNQWFDSVRSFSEGFAGVKLNDKWNFINQNGKYLNPNQWFDRVGSFREEFAIVYLDDKGYNFINQNGKYLNPNQWFNWVDDFHEGFARVKLRGKGYNFINTKGQWLNPNQWFDRVDNFHKGFAGVELNDKCNFINTEGELLSPNQWFDRVDNFHKGFAIVELNGRYNFINTECQLLSPNQWFDWVNDFHEGFAYIKLNGKGYNFINTKRELLSPNQWFDWVDDFHEGFANVKLNGKWFKIDKEGRIVT